MGCRQVVRLWFLVPASGGSNPSIPAKLRIDLRGLFLICQWLQDSNPRMGHSGVKNASGILQGNVTNELYSFDWLSGSRNVTESLHPSQIKTTTRMVVILIWPGWSGPEPPVTFAKQKSGRFGVEIEAKKCLHFFANERRSQLAGDIPPSHQWLQLCVLGIAERKSSPSKPVVKIS